MACVAPRLRANVGYHTKECGFVLCLSPAGVPPVVHGEGESLVSNNHKLLSLALIVFGAIFCLIYPLAMIWPSGWAWHDGAPAANDYYMMIVGIYATLGVMLILAARDPAANTSLIRFTIWSSVVHAAVMAWEATRTPGMHGHLMGDVPALLLVAIVLGALTMTGSPATDRHAAV